MGAFLIKRYLVVVDGFDPGHYFAASHGKARRDAWLSYTHCDSRCKFGDFLKISRVIRAPNTPGMGDKITVGGKPAFKVSYDGHYVQFARPGCDRVMNSHPLDVEPGWPSVQREGQENG